MRAAELIHARRSFFLALPKLASNSQNNDHFAVDESHPERTRARAFGRRRSDRPRGTSVPAAISYFDSDRDATGFGFRAGFNHGDDRLSRTQLDLQRAAPGDVRLRF